MRRTFTIAAVALLFGVLANFYLGALLLMKSQLEKADGDIVIRASEKVVLQALAAAHFEKKFTIESPA